MRDGNILKQFENMKTLYQYLYMSEENCIVIHNAINVPLRLRMNDNGIILCKNMNFPEFEETNWTEHMTIGTIVGIVEQLEDMPAIEYPDSYRNRWEEIKGLCSIQVSLNKGI